MQGYVTLTVYLYIQISVCIRTVDSFIEKPAYIIPESPVIALGSRLRASCILNDSFIKENKVDANQIFWNLKGIRVSEDNYHTVNSTVSNVTLNMSSVGNALLTCNVQLNEDQVITVFGIQIKVGLPPEKPKNLSCITYHRKNMTCSWNPGNSTYLPTTYQFKLSIAPDNLKSHQLPNDVNSSYAILFPNIHYFVFNTIWVEVKNDLGNTTSDSIQLDPVDVIKPDPPVITSAQQIKNMSTVLSVKWEKPSVPATYKLKYILRYKIVGPQNWMQVPPEDTDTQKESFSIQELKPFTEYAFTIRCKRNDETGYWSDWSLEKIGKTPEAKPFRGPPIWRTVENLDSSKRRICIMWKELEKSDANGIIVKYKMTIKKKSSTNIKKIETKKLEYNITLSDGEYEITLGASNSAGDSPNEILILPAVTESAFLPVQNVSTYPQAGQLMVEWKSPGSAVSGYVIEWCEESIKDSCSEPLYWKTVKKAASKVFLKDNIMPFKRYKITIYPMYSGRPGAPRSKLAYLQQDRPASGPLVHLKHVGKKEVKLMWSEIPVKEQRGFITHYTIFYRSCTANETSLSIVVDAMCQEHELTSLKGNTLYVVRVMASTVKGGTNSSEVNFTTLSYAKGEIEAIVVPICLSFLLITVVTILFCFNKRHLIKKYIWPNVPDPANSRVVEWSPSTGNLIQNNLGPKEPMNPDGVISDVTIIEADVDDEKYLSNEDEIKQLTSLKKEKSTSEEHSSGIGGSSCMSSPRQSVSDSDSESVQNTTSTVQYSTVLVSSPGYRCQQPSAQAFARSESTQPLLENEEKPDEHAYGNFGTCSLGVKRQYFKQHTSIEETNLNKPHPNEAERLDDTNEDNSFRLNQMEVSDQNSHLEGFCPTVDTFQSSNNQTVVKLEFLGFRPGLETDQQSYMPQAVKHNSYMPQSK
ncbi:interleukin-6 receptor subunit beta [Stegostoma tigrinum]|uniref:interleukin-6 receptor subunit beta n=1 Tax=Stegostoma tigrinum TaxID=3053191 RepID=UPI00202B11F6|nr:interleukin-6 receptor subunit beta [Stegostoma tigrinum]XP_048393812.1 interleukin-6 receptor subunit beta [Stegostoma tigrinum]